MEFLLILALVAVLQLAGMGVLAYLFLKMMKSVSADVRTLAMFKKSRTREDLFAMQSMGINEEGAKEEEAEDEEEELYTADEIPQDVLAKIAKSDGSE